jgi:hypothetical protein
MPIYHPAAVLRQWSWRITTVIDVIKARKEVESLNKGIPFEYPHREVSIEPESPKELWDWYHAHLGPNTLVSVDIETNRRVAPLGPCGIRNQITCIAFSGVHDRALVVPFTRSDNSHYWPDVESELQAWLLVQHIVETHPTLFQWGFYDVYMLYMVYRIRARLWRADTSIRHHSRYPELPKNLEYMGSTFTRERAWKLRRAKSAVDKKED